MNTNTAEFQAMMRVHAGLPRQGPGSVKTTVKALQLLPAIGKEAVIFDAGCGPGLATVVLAEKLQQKIIAVDLSEDFLKQVKRNGIAHGVANFVETRCGDMAKLDAAPNTVSLIWSEGAVYCIGFDNGIITWRPLLAPGGMIACTELSWLGEKRSNQAREFWRNAYPAMRSIDENLVAIKSNGYVNLGHFILPESCWWDEYYNPLSLNVRKLESEARQDPYLAAACSNASAEIELYREHSEEYGYVFYLMKTTGS
jgi:SAM-dependent methyltransferase